MEIITNRYKRETGLSAYKYNFFGKRIHNQKYIDWLENQLNNNRVTSKERDNYNPQQKTYCGFRN